MVFRRDEQKAQYFWLEIMSFYTADQLLVLDETAKDRRASRADVGWGLRRGYAALRPAFAIGISLAAAASPR